MIYILTGGPATGKGTRSDILANALEIPHISTGDMLRNVAKKNLEIREKLSNGELISDEIITNLLEQRILEDDCKEGFVLDGYPRTLKQAELLDVLLAKYGRAVTKVMELTIPDELAFKRILGRSKCTHCGASYGIDFPPKRKGRCDICGGHLAVRTDDTAETLSKRIETYKENSKPILDYYRDKGILMTVDASAHPERVVEEAQMEI